MVNLDRRAQIYSRAMAALGVAGVIAFNIFAPRAKSTPTQSAPAQQASHVSNTPAPRVAAPQPQLAQSIVARAK